MGALKNLMQRVQDEARAKHAKEAAQTSTPPSLPDVGVADPAVTNRLADLFAQTFGSSGDSSNLPVVAVPVNPPASGGGGVSLGKVALLAGLGVGGWLLWEKFGAHA